MKKVLVCAAFAMAATTLHAAIFYNATIGCQHSCVTVTLSWAAEPFGVYSAAVEDSLDNVIFTLNLGSFAGQTTGSILPSPQTFGSLSPSDIFTLGNGQAYLSISSVKPGLLGGGQGGEDGTPFIAQDLPEPESWSLIGAGLALLICCGVRREREGRRGKTYFAM